MCDERRVPALRAGSGRRAVTIGLGFAIALLVGAMLTAWPAPTLAAPQPLSSWQEVIRKSPYWESQGVYDNLVTIRRWVLAQEAYCADEQRHILFDHRATFLGYVEAAADAHPTAQRRTGDQQRINQQRIDERRRALAAAGKVDAWSPGEIGRIGYPFALSCQQPDAHLGTALDRYTGTDPAARLWGTWDGMRIGTREQPVSLHEAIREVYDFRRATGRVTMPEHVLSTLAGKTIIESGGLRHAHSAAGARGIMQLSAAALADCRIDERHYFHRIAQIDCALYLLEQNHRNLAPAFAERFGGLPEGKARALYDMLLLQAYHGGVGRVRGLLAEQAGREVARGTGAANDAAARYFALHHERFSAGDIALGIVLHNLGRDRLGFASLYYVTDVGIATRAACARVEDLPGCGTPRT